MFPAPTAGKLSAGPVDIDAAARAVIYSTLMNAPVVAVPGTAIGIVMVPPAKPVNVAFTMLPAVAPAIAMVNPDTYQKLLASAVIVAASVADVVAEADVENTVAGLSIAYPGGRLVPAPAPPTPFDRT